MGKKEKTQEKTGKSEKPEKPLSPAQTKRVESMKTKLNKAKTKLEETVKSSEEASNQECINPKVLDKARAQCALLTSSVASLEFLVAVNTGGNAVQKELEPIVKQLDETETLQKLCKAQLDCSSEL